MFSKEIICIIPARKGSKAIKNKNIKIVKKKPLIQYTIDTAKKIGDEVDICVSTDSNSVIKIIKKNKLNFYGKRPKILAGDYAETYDVVKYEIKKYEKILKKKYKFILLLQPTCPIRDINKIKKAIKKIKLNKKLDSIISVTDVNANHPNRMKIFKNNYLINYNKSKKEDMRPRQKLPKVYIRSGSIYLTTRNSLFKNKSLVGKKCAGIILGGYESLNIDTINDLNFFKSINK